MDTFALNQCQLLSSSSLVSLDKRDKPIQWTKGPCHEPRFAPPSSPGPPHCFPLFSPPSPGPPPPSKLRLSSLYPTLKQPNAYRIISCPYPFPNNTHTLSYTFTLLNLISNT